jgi:hypothetical protein
MTKVWAVLGDWANAGPWTLRTMAQAAQMLASRFNIIDSP